jgi:hypothetical protein
MRPYLKNNNKRAGVSVAQAVELLPSKNKALNSNLSITKKRKEIQIVQWLLIIFHYSLYENEKGRCLISTLTILEVLQKGTGSF